jgi:hypothetical protein
LLLLRGRLSAAEKERLRILGRITGMHIDPSKLLPVSRAIQRDKIEEQLNELGIAAEPASLLSACASASPQLLDALYTDARYAGDSAEWRAIAAKILRRACR